MSMISCSIAKAGSGRSSSASAGSSAWVRRAWVLRLIQLTFNVGKNGERVIVVAVSKQDLMQAPGFTATEKTTFDKVKDKASDLGHQAADKAVELKDQAAQKIEGMRKGESAKQ